MSDAELDELEKQIINSLSSRAKAMVTMAAPSAIPEPSAGAQSGQRTSRPNRSVPEATSMTRVPMQSTSSLKTKASSMASERKRKLASINRLIRKKRLLGGKTEELASVPASPSSNTRYELAPTIFPFFPKHALTLANAPAQALTQPGYASLDLSTLAAPPLSVAPNVAPIDFAATLATLNLSFDMASISVANGVEMVLHVYASMFEKQYSATIEDRMLYASNRFAMRQMAEEMGTKAQACTFAHWHQIARSLISQISTVV